jgi:hypothetical protein
VRIRFGEAQVVPRLEQRLSVLLLSRMACPAAQALLEHYAKAAMEHFEAADKLSNLVGQHGQFEEQREDAERAYEKCSAARLALEHHWAQHRCRDTDRGTKEKRANKG